MPVYTSRRMPLLCAGNPVGKERKPAPMAIVPASVTIPSRLCSIVGTGAPQVNRRKPTEFKLSLASRCSLKVPPPPRSRRERRAGVPPALPRRKARLSDHHGLASLGRAGETPALRWSYWQDAPSVFGGAVLGAIQH